MLKKTILQFLISRFTSSLGDQFLLFAVPLIIYKSTQSIALSGLAFFIEWLPRIISLPIAGLFSDKFGGRRIYLIADGVRSFICIIGFIVATLFPQQIFYSISILMAICAFFYAQSFIAMESSIPRIVSQQDLPKAQSIVQGVEQSTFILGPMLASICVLFLPITVMLLVTSLVFALSFTLIFFLRGFKLAPPIQVGTSQKFFNDMKKGFAIVLHSHELIMLTLLTISINLVWGLMLSTNAAMVTGVFHHSASVFGLMQTAAGISAIAMFFIIPAFVRRFSIFTLGILSGLIMICGGYFAGISPILGLYSLGYAMVISMDGVFNVYIRTERAKLIPKEHMGKAIGVIVLCNQISMPLSGLIVAKFSHSVGVQHLFIIISTITLISFVFCMLRLQKLIPVGAKI